MVGLHEVKIYTFLFTPKRIIFFAPVKSIQRSSIRSRFLGQGDFTVSYPFLPYILTSKNLFDLKVIVSKGEFYHRLDLQDNMKKIFAKIMKKHTYQEDWFRLKAIYNDFYGDPSKGIDTVN